MIAQHSRSFKPHLNPFPEYTGSSLQLLKPVKAGVRDIDLSLGDV